MSLKTLVKDSFVNFAARLGVGANNQFSQGHYQHNWITKNRGELEAAYRGSWIIGKVVNVPAEDMTQAGIEIQSTLEPDEIEKLQTEMLRLKIWPRICQGLAWGRLFGGAIAVMMIDGQKFDTPLNVDSIGEGQFKGIFILDRWLLQPSLSDLISDFGPDLGMPKYYTVNMGGPASPAMAGLKIHHSRVIRFEGLDLPFYQKQTEMLWGESVVERIWDRLLAFDSTTQGAAQLVFKAHLRTMSVEGLREIIAMGGKAMEGLAAQIENIRLYQSSEGLTLLDAKDKLEHQSYTFAGLSDILMQFAQQLSGAVEIPLVRLLGQSPAGLNSSGDSDLRTYYDGIKRKQETDLRVPVMTLLDVLARSVLGAPLPEGSNFTFRSLWQLSDTEKAQIAQNVTTAINTAVEMGVPLHVGLKELRQSSHVTGIYSNITDEDIEEAENAPPPGETEGDEPQEEPDNKEKIEEPEDA